MSVLRALSMNQLPLTMFVKKSTTLYIFWLISVHNVKISTYFEYFQSFFENAKLLSEFEAIVDYFSLRKSLMKNEQFSKFEMILGGTRNTYFFVWNVYCCKFNLNTIISFSKIWVASFKKISTIKRVSEKVWFMKSLRTGSLMCLQRRRDICGRTTSIWQFLSEMQQTWHSYYSRPQK
jgi:hypothetical protein